MENRLSFIVIMGLLFSSCQKDIDLDIPSPAPRLGINAIWDRNNPLEVLVTRSFSIAETPQFDYITDPATIENKRKKYSVPNAEVWVYRNGAPYDRLQFNDQQYIYKSTSGKTAAPGADYQVKVTTPDFVDVTSPRASFPDLVPIKGTEVKRRVATDGQGSPLDEIVLEFDDPGTSGNYYWLKLSAAFGSNPSGHYYPITVYPVDKDIIMPSGSEITTELPSIEGDRILLKDENFNGQRKRVLLRIPSWILDGGRSVELTLSLNHASEDLFNYIRSRVLDVRNPFATPVQAFSNITDGLGIFGLYTSDKRILY